jgi:hypothetical protein
MVKIYKINWLSKEAQEAEVYLSDGDFSIVCFAHPFNQALGDIITLPLHSLNTQEIYIQKHEKKVSIQREGESFKYKLSGRVINNVSNHVKIGEFIIALDVPLPGDIEISNYISLTCDRLDIY